MKSQEVKELEKLYMSWPNEKLLRSIMFERDCYEPEAIKIMLQELDKRALSQEEIVLAQSIIEEDIHKKEKDLLGLRGFLLLFLVILAVNSLISIVTGIGVLSLYNLTSIVLIVVSISMFFIGGYGIFTLFMLCLKRTSAPVYAKRWLIFKVKVGILNSLLFYYKFGEVNLTFVIFTAFFAIIWYEYFLRSRRVSITYRL